MAYRTRFWMYFVLTGFESVVVFLSLKIIFIHIYDIAGWSYADMLVLVGTFMLTHSLAWLTFKGGVGDLDRRIKDGQLDWLIVKPIDTQFLVSMNRIDIEDSGRSVIGIAAIIMGLKGSSIFGVLINLPLFILTLFLGQVVLYSFMLSTKSISFKSIEGWATNSVAWRFHELARFPTDIYRGALRIIYTFVFPLTFIATVPAKVLTGKFNFYMLIGAIIAASLTFTISRIIWKYALSTYSSASS